MSESPERVTTEDVQHVAALARVDLDESEAEAFPDQFADILDYFAALDEVPEAESEPELVNVMRADETREGLTQEAALSNAPESEAGYVVGPRVS